MVKLTVVLLGLAACATSAPPARTAASEPDVAGVPDAAPAPAPPAPPDAAPAAPPDAAPAVAAPSNDVHGTVALNIATHCGGAAPRPDEQMSRRQLAVGHKLYVRAKSGKKVAEVTSDKSGAFAIHLAPGAYCLISAGKADDKTPPSQYVDAACLASYRAQCDAVFTVPRAEPVVVELYQGCFGPCYHGPMPP
jgi:hypothetical protein